MTKKQINVTDYAGDILKALTHGGILVTTKNGEKINSMVIGWGTLGTNWGRPTFVTYVRQSRFTKEQLDANPEFTVNIPMGDFDRNILKVCGTLSGRNIDKVKEAGLTPVDPEVISVPGIKEFPLTLECKVMYAQKQELSLLPEDMRERMYPRNVGPEAPGANRDEHTSFYGEIVSAYIIED